MSAKRNARSGIGMIALVALVVIAALMLVPGVATFFGSLIAGLWVTVMGTVAGILGGIVGS